ncbi:MAG: hypothetical protein WBF34_28310, partial [Streptosporangiaceae bacterium]
MPDSRVYPARSPLRSGSPPARYQAWYQRSKSARIAMSSGSLSRAALSRAALSGPAEAAMRSDVAASAP